MNYRKHNYYEILGVSFDASFDEIKKVYRRLSQELHPDKTFDDREKAERFNLVAEAYSVLSDDAKRRKYNRSWLEYHDNVTVDEASRKLTPEELKQAQYMEFGRLYVQVKAKVNDLLEQKDALQKMVYKRLLENYLAENIDLTEEKRREQYIKEIAKKFEPALRRLEKTAESKNIASFRKSKNCKCCWKSWILTITRKTV